MKPNMPKTFRHEDGRVWNRDLSGTPKYSSEDGKFDILIGNGYVVLVAFDHDPIDDAEFWRKRFESIEDAADYAERM